MSVDMAIVPKNVYYLKIKNKKAIVPFHTAKTDDSWQRISQQYGIRLVNLLKFNRTISKNYPLESGQIVWLDKKRPRKTPVKIFTPQPVDTVTLDPMITTISDTLPEAMKDLSSTASEKRKGAGGTLIKSSVDCHRLRHKDKSIDSRNYRKTSCGK